VKKVGDKKQLNFEGLKLKADQPQPVGAGVSGGDEASSTGEDEE
jgi:hypothetical protein